jgi:3-phenylpropionate/trans-cinnamate dioxygenase ferredoxin reductase subunit
MAHYRYLIIGGGMSADAAARGIRELDPEGSLALFTDEAYPPYNRPPLSKALWKGESLETIWRDEQGLNLQIHLETPIVALNPQAHEVRDAHGGVHTFEKLLLATGARPRRLPILPEAIYFRTLADYERLRSSAHKVVTVLGGGFIGSELAAALRMNGLEVHLVFPEEGLGGRLFPPELSRFLVEFYKEKGVQVWPGRSVVGWERGELLLEGGERLPGNLMVAGLGVEPEVGLARQAGLEVTDGIVVDEQGRTSTPWIYATGDVANFWNPTLGRRLRVEHEDHANTHGLLVGRNMAGAMEPYTHLPFFYSDLFELGYEAVGVLDGRMETVSDWKEPFREGVVYYLEGGRVRGVLLWNTWGQVEAARALLAEPGPFRPQDLKGRLG